MKRRRDPVAFVFGICFIVASLVLGNPDRVLELDQLGVVAPGMLIAIGVAIVARNRRSGE
jgi:hypothetical protein